MALLKITGITLKPFTFVNDSGQNVTGTSYEFDYLSSIPTDFGYRTGFFKVSNFKFKKIFGFDDNSDFFNDMIGKQFDVEYDVDRMGNSTLASVRRHVDNVNSTVKR
jgi:hypothetical protein